MDIFNCEQNSEEWIRARLGIPTASQFSTVMAKGRGGKGESKTRMTYMLKLIGERMTGEPADNFTNAHMERGHEMEPLARDKYSFISGNEPKFVGFIRNGNKGASPDALIGEDGLLEIKTKLPHLHLATVLADQVPPEHIPQVQGQICVAEREWCDFVSYWPKLPIFIKRVYRDDDYIKKLEQAVDMFSEEMAVLMQKIERSC